MAFQKGKYPTYPELRAKVHDKILNVQVDEPSFYEKSGLIICKASITFDVGNGDTVTFSEIGEADFEQDKKQAGNLARMAATRAKKRCIADFLNEQTEDVDDGKPAYAGGKFRTKDEDDEQEEVETICEDCGDEITAWGDKTGEEWALSRKKQYGAPLCGRCVAKRKKASK